MRIVELSRKTTETEIRLRLNLDGTGHYDIKTGIGFFDHMLEQLAKHSLIDLSLLATGDLHIDNHHTVEDCGILLGQAFARALGEKSGIRRYGHFHLVMDDAQVVSALDFSGRPYLLWNVAFPTTRVGAFDTELIREFFQAFCVHSGVTLHVDMRHGLNTHHIAEACFKSVARSMRMAVETDPRIGDSIPSTKGTL